MADFRRLLLGRRLASDETHATKISNPVALAVFSSDALSSVAYATQEIMASLSTAIGHGGAAAAAAGGAAAFVFGLSVPVAIGITLLLLILAFSYRQTILEYPSGGGAYIVAKENLGETAAQTAGASLLVDYILTVAVSVSSGIAAITAAAPVLQDHNVALTLLAIAFIAMANLRGVKESGALFSIPTYGFLVSILVMIFIGFAKWIAGVPAGVQAHQVEAAVGNAHNLAGLALIWVFMRAYSAGCTALTGVEAISNGVTAFKEPSGPNAAKTMIAMVLLLGTMFLGITLLAHHYGVVYHHSTDPRVVQETLLSNLTRHVLGHNGVVTGLGKVYYYVIQGFTFAILVVAANTAYADFPRLAALQAKDGFLPNQFASMGDRLVFSNGILILSVFAGFLVVLFHANTDVLLPLYALGVFLGFTISQTGMVVHWRRKQGPHWKVKAVVNGIGACASAIVMLDIAITKFVGGAWIVIVLVPILVTTFFNIHRHYIKVKSTLAASRTDAFLPSKHHAIVLVSGLHAGVVQALSYARLISGNRVEALTVDLGSDGFHESPAIQKLRADWAYYGMGVPLRSVPSPYRKVVEPILEEVTRFRLAEPEVCLTMILPEYVTPKWWQRVLHNQMAFRIKASLMLKPGVIVTSVRMHLPD
ncbi:APC family permease [Mesoterricola sediminis]|uniref:Amino acid permease n=1 Tax=Mesoterricola sediminis TaxID=2927980 RepID=A0AA48GYV2_9BACT|nr:APC family permease [Mesoterricola sediminis]BDU78794.1 amino acid permease [Mesoterricola sediminis]